MKTNPLTQAASWLIEILDLAVNEAGQAAAVVVHPDEYHTGWPTWRPPPARC